MLNVDKTHIAQLCRDLTVILEAELQAGNKVVETSRGWPSEDSIMLMLDRPFEVKLAEITVSAYVEYHDMNDPHCWKAEYYCSKHQHILACRFARAIPSWPLSL